ncbi:MAG: MerR family transcriptional regulator [Bacteroidota bacterium]
MFKIGEFSKMCRVSVRSLRHYDELGLLRPERIDPETGYRYYRAEQLHRLHRILALKDLGINLEQIAGLLKEDLPADKVRDLLLCRKAEVEETLVLEQERLARIVARLEQIERKVLMPYEVILKSSPALQVAAYRKTVPAYRDEGAMWGEICPLLERASMTFTGPPLAIYHDPEYREKEVDIEVAVPATGTLPEYPGLAMRELPEEETMACTLYQGPYEGVSAAFEAIMQWIEGNGYRIAGPTREVYLKGPDQTKEPKEYLTEVQVPVKKGS